MLRRVAVVAIFTIPSLLAQAPVMVPNVGGGVAGGLGGGGVIRPDPANVGQRPGNAQDQQQSQQQQAPGSIEGIVTNAATGQPLKRVTLMLMPMQPSSNGGAPISDSTDASGMFIIRDVPPGMYRMSAERNGFVRTTYGAKGPMQPGTTLKIAPGQAVKEIAIPMQPHAVISGRVLDDEGEPLPHVQVQAMSSRYMNGRRQMLPNGGGTTNDLGEYRLFGLAPGKYIISATHRAMGMMSGFSGTRPASATNAIEDEGYGQTYYPGTHELTSAVPLQVEAGQPATSIDFKLRRVRTFRISGKVVGPGQPGRTAIMLVPQDDAMAVSGPRNSASTRGPDGSFEIRGVTPGSYFIIAQQLEQNTQLIARVPVTVGNAHLENIELAVRPGASLTGQVRIEGATAATKLEDVMVSLQSSAMAFGGPSSATAGADGTFSIPNVSPGNYRVMAAIRRGQAMYVKSVYAGDRESPAHEVTVADGPPPALTLLLSTAVANVSGQVTTDKPAALQGSMVVLVPSAEKRQRMDLYRMATPDQTGKYNVPSVPPGEYTLYAFDEAEPGSWMDPEFLAKFESKGKKIAVKESDRATADIALVKVAEAQ